MRATLVLILFTLLPAMTGGTSDAAPPGTPSVVTVPSPLRTPGSTPAAAPVNSPGTAAQVAGAKDRQPDAPAEKTYKGALQFLRRGRLYDRANAALEKLVIRYPSVAKYHEALGLARLALALEQSAEEPPDRDTPDSAGRPDGFPSPGELFEAGVAQIEEAILISPDVSDFYHSLGWAHLANARLGLNGNAADSRRRAEEAFKAALRLNPSEITYRWALADYYRMTPAPPAPLPDPAPSPDHNVGTARVEEETGDHAPQSRGDTDPGPPEKPSGSDPGPAAPTPNENPPGAAPPPSEAPAKPNTTAAPPPPSPALRAFRRISIARPRDAGLHYVLYEEYLKEGDTAGALAELQAARGSDPSNALYAYLLAFYADGDVGGNDNGLGDPQSYVLAAQTATSFRPVPYEPSYPVYLAPALRRALGDSLTPETLKLYDRLAELARRLTESGNRRMEAGYPEEAEGYYFQGKALGERLVNSAMGARDRYLLHLPELSAGLKAEDLALSALRRLYSRYARADRYAWLQQEQSQLDRIRRIISRSTDAGNPDSGEEGGEY